MIVLALLLMGSFYWLSLTDDDSFIYWRVLTGITAVCILWTVALALL